MYVFCTDVYVVSHSQTAFFRFLFVGAENSAPINKKRKKAVWLRETNVYVCMLVYNYLTHLVNYPSTAVYAQSERHPEACLHSCINWPVVQDLKYCSEVEYDHRPKTSSLTISPTMSKLLQF